MSRAMIWGGGGLAALGLICCFTPLLPIVLTAIGAAGLIDTLYRDAVLLPVVAVSALIFGVGLWMLRTNQH